MKIIRRIIIANILFILFLIPSVYAQYPTSTPQTIEPNSFTFIDGIKDALSSITVLTGTEQTGEVSENMASGSSASSNITIITWSGGGEDNLASTAANWSGGMSPQNGDGVLFDTTSKNCTWDLAVILVSFSINPGYTGKVTLEANLIISDDFIWTGMGEDNLASNPVNWSRNAVPEDGYRFVFNGSSSKDCVWDISISPALLSMESTYSGNVSLNTDLSITGDLSIEGGFLNLNNKSLSVDGDLLIGTYGTLYATSSIIKVKCDWTNRGAFDSGTSTVILNGTNQTVYGDNTFYNLVKTTDLADTLRFEAGKTQTILNNLILQGLAGNLLSLRSTQDGHYWQIDPQGTRSISFVDIEDMNNINVTSILVPNSHNSGHNNNIDFSGSECVLVEDRRLIC